MELDCKFSEGSLLYISPLQLRSSISKPRLRQSEDFWLPSMRTEGRGEIRLSLCVCALVLESNPCRLIHIVPQSCFEKSLGVPTKASALAVDTAAPHITRYEAFGVIQHLLKPLAIHLPSLRMIAKVGQP